MKVMIKITAAVFIPMIVLAAASGLGILDFEISSLCLAASAALFSIAFLQRSYVRAVHSAKAPLLTSLQELKDSYAAADEKAEAVLLEFENTLSGLKNTFDSLQLLGANLDAAIGKLPDEADRWEKNICEMRKKASAAETDFENAAESAEAVLKQEQKIDEQVQSEKAAFEAVFKSSRTMGLCFSEVQKQANQMNHLALELKEAMEMAADLSSQADLLALNASIEAARAGEKDKGFSIVASEIRALAEQCRQSSDKLTDMAEKLADYTGQGVQKVYRAIEAAGEQNDKLEDMAAACEGMYQEIAVGSRLAAELPRQVEAAGKKSKELLPGLNQLSADAKDYIAGTKDAFDFTVQLKQKTEEYEEKIEDLQHLSARLEKILDRQVI